MARLFHVLSQVKPLKTELHKVSKAAMSSSDDEAGDGAAIAPPRAKTMSRWKPEEDVMLSQLVNVQLRNMATEDQTINWTKISASMASRTSKQCRERYVNHIK